MKGIGKQRQRMDHVPRYQLDEEEDGADHHHGDDPRGLRPSHGDELFAPVGRNASRSQQNQPGLFLGGERMLCFESGWATKSWR